MFPFLKIQFSPEALAAAWVVVIVGSECFLLEITSFYLFPNIADAAVAPRLRFFEGEKRTFL